jgi:solute carrier family 25 phosphate transporter 23/24/25/41
MADAFITVARTEGMLAWYKGLGPTLIGIAPYASLNFCLYDLAKRHIYDAGDK